jgi:23S rRNA (cytidine1920-2'-O)/16S rRNA (cytidine1409-2'-O)-methyltransferase
LGRKARRRLRPLEQELGRRRPDIVDPAAVVAAGDVLVDGRIVTNPASLVAADSSIVVRRRRPLRGEAKLHAALAAFDVRVDGRVAVDAGAAAGGFTRALLEAGAARVYAVDAGHGQLLGSLRADPRVVNLEGVNLGELNTTVVPDTVELVTLDLSYLSLADAVPQLAGLSLAGDAELVALVKPAFELRLAAPPERPDLLMRAVEQARAGIERSGWQVLAQLCSPVTGAHGAVEFLVHARRRC